MFRKNIVDHIGDAQLSPRFNSSTSWRTFSISRARSIAVSASAQVHASYQIAAAEMTIACHGEQESRRSACDFRVDVRPFSSVPEPGDGPSRFRSLDQPPGDTMSEEARRSRRVMAHALPLVTTCSVRFCGRRRAGRDGSREELGTCLDHQLV
jgi:hypothetical protein